MDTLYLREFLQVVDAGSFQEVASRLFISQSSLSKHIKAIESELGVYLFNRSSRQLKLTEQGEAFLPYARKITALQDEWSAMFAEFGQRVVIGSFPQLSEYGITDLLAKIQKKHPRLSVDLFSKRSDELASMLYKGECDFAFIREESTRYENLLKTRIMEDRAVAIVPSDHPLAARGVVSMAELKDEGFLLPPKKTGPHCLFLNLCRSAGFEPRISYTYVDGASGIDMASKHMGIALLMGQSCERAMQGRNDAVMLELEPSVPIRVYLASKAKNSLSPAAQTFLETVHELGYRDEYE